MRRPQEGRYVISIEEQSYHILKDGWDSTLVIPVEAYAPSDLHRLLTTSYGTPEWDLSPQAMVALTTWCEPILASLLVGCGQRAQLELGWGTLKGELAHTPVVMPEPPIRAEPWTNRLYMPREDLERAVAELQQPSYYRRMVEAKMNAEQAWRRFNGDF